MALEDVDVVELESLEGALDRGEDTLRSQRDFSFTSNLRRRTEELTFLLNPFWLTRPAGPPSESSGLNVLVRITTLSRGISCFLRNLPRMISDSPAEYLPNY